MTKYLTKRLSTGIYQFEEYILQCDYTIAHGYPGRWKAIWNGKVVCEAGTKWAILSKLANIERPVSDQLRKVSTDVYEYRGICIERPHRAYPVWLIAGSHSIFLSRQAAIRYIDRLEEEQREGHT